MRTISIAAILWSSAAVAQVPPPQLPPRPPSQQLPPPQQQPRPDPQGRRPAVWADMMSDMIFWYRTLGVGGEGSVNDPIISGHGNEDLWTISKAEGAAAQTKMTVSPKRSRNVRTDK